MSRPLVAPLRASVGHWQAALGLVVIDAGRGPHVKTMGVTIAGRRYLYPEEAIFLLERDALTFASPTTPLPSDLQPDRCGIVSDASSTPWNRDVQDTIVQTGRCYHPPTSDANVDHVALHNDSDGPGDGFPMPDAAPTSPLTIALPADDDSSRWFSVLAAARALTESALVTYLTLRHQGYVTIRWRQFARQQCMNQYKDAVDRHYEGVRAGRIEPDVAPPSPPDDLALTDGDEPVWFCVWLPDQLSAFSPSKPGRPQFVVVPQSVEDPVPTLETMKRIKNRIGGITRIRLAITELKTVLFVDFDDSETIPIAS